ncbi:MAG: tripartite tricarboxylate transporter TctB family protein [Desulfofustis sp.]|nr:tripartite tricarboxylate transporter TctB family protein [Desulfofustis sp.]
MKKNIPERSDAAGRGRTSPPPGVDRADSILAAIILAVCGSLFFVTTRFEEASEQMSQNIPPEWFPRLILLFIMILTLAIPFERYFKGKKVAGKEREVSVKPISIVTALLLCLIIFLMPWLGIFATMILVCLLLPLLWGERRLRVLLPFAIIFPGAVTLLFTKVLGVYFETGIWSKLF